MTAEPDQAAWPEFQRRARQILAEIIVDPEVADELAGMLADVASRTPGPVTQPWMWAGTDTSPVDPTDLTPEERDVIAARFKAESECPHCGGLHLRACPRVRRLKMYPSGDIEEVEFWPDGQWPSGNIFWPEDFPVAKDDA